jgi:hypothetical protein
VTRGPVAFGSYLAHAPVTACTSAAAADELVDLARMTWPELALTGAGSSPGRLTELDEAGMVELAVAASDRILVGGKM